MFRFTFASILLLAVSQLAHGQYTTTVAEGYRVDSADGGGVTWTTGYQGLGYQNNIHCNPVQQFTDLPSSGSVLQQFWTSYDPFSSTVTGTIRIGLYSVSGTTYTLLASTNASSDLYAPSSAYGAAYTWTIIRSNGPLYYANASLTSLSLDPVTSYAMCFHSSASAANQATVMLAWPIITPTTTAWGSTSYTIGNAMPSSMTSSGTSSAVYQMWITASVPTSTSPVVNLPSAGQSLGWRSAPSYAPVVGLVSVNSELRCDPVQQFTSLPPTGALLTSFSTVYSPAMTMEDGGLIRVALYAVDSTNAYTLVAYTNASSDIQAPQGVDAGPTIITSASALSYPSGSSYLVLPNISYALCFFNNDQTNIVAQYAFKLTSGTVPTLSTYNLTQPLPANPSWTGTNTNGMLLWMNVQTPVPTPTVFYDTRCGGGVFNLSGLQTTDLMFNDGTYAWYLRVCGSTTTPVCATSSNGYETAMLCQYSSANGNAYGASYNQPTQYLWNVTAMGLTLTVQDGAFCGSPYLYSRETVISFVCSTNANTPVFSGVVEQPPCVYTVVVFTNAVCAGPSNSSGSLPTSTGTTTTISSSSVTSSLAATATVSSTSPSVSGLISSLPSTASSAVSSSSSTASTPISSSSSTASIMSSATSLAISTLVSSSTSVASASISSAVSSAASTIARFESSSSSSSIGPAPHHTSANFASSTVVVTASTLCLIVMACIFIVRV